jgi:hypothetical protein
MNNNKMGSTQSQILKLIVRSDMYHIKKINQLWTESPLQVKQQVYPTTKDPTQR